jgi:hypothetical protein
VVAACQRCQRRKCKCNGARPVCEACSDRDEKCSYDVSEGIPQRNRFKQKYQALESKLNDSESLISKLTHSNEEAAQYLLVRLRAGEPIEDLVQSVSETDSSIAASTSPETCNVPFPYVPVELLGGPLINPMLVNGSGSIESHLETDDFEGVLSTLSEDPSQHLRIYEDTML